MEAAADRRRQEQGLGTRARSSYSKTAKNVWSIYDYLFSLLLFLVVVVVVVVVVAVAA
jgi:hypothetical protein